MSTDLTDRLLTAALGGAAVLFFRYILGEIALRWLRRGEFAFDGIVDVMSTVTGIERQLANAKKSPDHLPTVKSANDLRIGPDTWHLRGLVIGLDRYLDVLDNHELHRQLILFHDQFARFERWRDVHREAFYWLLDNSEKWALPQGEERLEQIATARQSIADAFKRCVAHGYQAVCSLAVVADSSPRLNRLQQGTVEHYLRKHYGLTVAELEAKVAAAETAAQIQTS